MFSFRFFPFLQPETCLWCSHIALVKHVSDFALWFWTGSSIMFVPRLGGTHVNFHLCIYRSKNSLFSVSCPCINPIYMMSFFTVILLFWSRVCLLSFQNDTVPITFMVPFGTTCSVVHLGSRSSSGKLGFSVRGPLFAALSLSGGQDSPRGPANSWRSSDRRLGSGMSENRMLPLVD